MHWFVHMSYPGPVFAHITEDIGQIIIPPFSPHLSHIQLCFYCFLTLPLKKKKKL